MKISDLRVIRQIGVGGEGAVVLVEGPDSQEYAFKLVNTKRPDDLRKEVTTVMTVDSPYVIKYYDLFFFDKPFHGYNAGILMEYINGIDVFDTITKTTFTSDHDRYRFFAKAAHDILSGLHAMHAKNIAHRDLKPENVMVDPTGPRFVLIDFGISCLIKPGAPELLRACNPTNKSGTRSLFSPQRAGNDLGLMSGYNPSLDDVWAVGVMLSFILNGDFPLPCDGEECERLVIKPGGREHLLRFKLSNKEDQKKARHLVSRLTEYHQQDRIHLKAAVTLATAMYET